ncbi:hypothetical protein BDV28DRAFT_153094, partial [Aspergillus coremiiformis]
LPSSSAVNTATSGIIPTAIAGSSAVSSVLTPSAASSTGLVSGLLSDVLPGSSTTNIPVSTGQRTSIDVIPTQSAVSPSVATPSGPVDSGLLSGASSSQPTSNEVIPTPSALLPLVTSPSAVVSSGLLGSELPSGLLPTSTTSAVMTSAVQDGSSTPVATPTGSGVLSETMTSSGLPPTIPISIPPTAPTPTVEVTPEPSNSVISGVSTSSGSTSSSPVIPGGSSETQTLTLGPSGPLTSPAALTPTSGVAIPTDSTDSSGSSMPSASSSILVSSPNPTDVSTEPSTPSSINTPTPIASTTSASMSTAQSTTEQPKTTENPAETTQATASQPTTAQPTTAQPTTAQPTAAQPTTTSETTDWVPSTILVEPPSPTTQNTATHSTTTTAPTQTQLPGSISPANIPIEPPADSTLIQLGFNGKLRYSFVATTPLSSSQIFLYIPIGLEYALQILRKEVSMLAIQPYNNSKSTGYVATVAMAYIPTTEVESLRKMLNNPNSALYQQADASAKALMSMIDPSIPLVVGESGSITGSSGPSNLNGSGGNTNGGNGNGANDPNSDAGASSSGSARASSVGIGVGVVAGAAAYGAGMFWVARRYRKKRQLHQRSSSNVEQMSEGRAAGSLFVPGGGMSRNSHNSRGTARTQMISAPVMAENSLGWN